MKSGFTHWANLEATRDDSVADLTDLPSYDLYWGILHDKIIAVGARIA